MKAAITGWGTALPPTRLDNGALAARLDVSEEWIYQRTGIRSRRIVEHETTTTLAIAASTAALAKASISSDAIDLVIVATTTSEYQLPSTASLVQAGLGCTNAGAFDLNAACSGFLYGLAQANSAIESGACRRVLVCGADTLSTMTDYTDVHSCILFGDGAGAVVVEATEGAAGLGPFMLRSDGSEPELLYIRADERLIKMQGREVYRRAVEAMTRALAQIVDEAGIALDDIALVVPHQANARIVEAVAARLGIDATKLVVSIEMVGNTSAASIPIALAEAADQGRLAHGDVVAIAAFGAGFAWGAGVLRWHAVVPKRQARRRLPALVGTTTLMELM